MTKLQKNVKIPMSLDGGLAKVLPKRTSVPRQKQSKHRADALNLQGLHGKTTLLEHKAEGESTTRLSWVYLLTLV